MDVTIRVDELVEGMYVADLDRPWTDTPFMLQGFPFDHAKHAETLREYCAYVYVNIERSVEPGAAVLARRFGPKPPKPLTRWQRFKRWLRLQLGLGPKRDKVVPVQRASLSPAGGAGDSTFTWQYDTSEPYTPSRLERLRQRLLQRMSQNEGPPPAAAFAQAGFVTSAQGHGVCLPPVVQRRSSPLLSFIVRLLEFFLPEQAVDIERHSLDHEAIVVQKRNDFVVHDRLGEASVTLARSRRAFATVIEDIRRDRKLQMTAANEAIDGLVDVASEHPHALVWLNKLKGVAASSYEHTIDVSIYMICVGRHLGYRREQLQILGLAGLLQDVGYISLPDELLSVPGPLTPAQYALVQAHVEHSLELLADTPGMPPKVLEIVAQHHERHDGSGYPRRLSKDQIDPLAQIAGLADTFHAMTSDRPHRKAMSTNETLQSLYKWKGGSFNEGLVEQFIQCIGIYSVGTIVELSSGETGIVIAQNRIRRLKPRVMILLDPDRIPCAAPRILELINDPVDEHGEPYSIRRDLPPGTHGIKPEEYFI